MSKYIITKESAKKIVEAGTSQVFKESFSKTKPVKGRHAEMYGHIIRELPSDITGPEDTAEIEINNKTVEVLCPLLRDEETISEGTIVVISRNMEEKRWEIIEAQCPEEEQEES